jgi:hypothetical protein
VGDKVRHNNDNLAEVIGLGSIGTNQGLTVTYNLKFLGGAAAWRQLPATRVHVPIRDC